MRDYYDSHGDRYDVPSRREAAADQAADRAEEARTLRDEAAARARGEYVPSWPMKLARSDLAWHTPCPPVPVREGVFWLPAATAATVDALADRFGALVELAVADGGVWLRCDPAALSGDPFDYSTPSPAARQPDMFWAQDVADQATRTDTRRTA